MGAMSAAAAQQVPAPDTSSSQSPASALAGQQMPANPTAPNQPPASDQSATQPAGNAVAPEDILRDIVVTGRQSVGGGNMVVQREPETTSSVSAKAITERAALSGPLQLVATLPGISTGQSDPYALAQRSFVYIRGLPSNEIGFLLEDIPVIDQAFFLPYSETYVDPENLAGITVLPGSSRITDPIQNAIGGEIITTVRDPSKELGGFIDYTHGSYRANRVFGRIDTGEIGNTGLRAFASGSYVSGGTFNLPGTGHRTHADFKAEKDWSGTAKSTLFLSYTDWHSERSSTVTLAQFNAATAANDFTIGNYAPTFVPGVTTNYYKLNYYERKNLIVSFKNEVNFGDKLTLTVVPYYHWTKSNSPGQTSVNPASVYNGNAKVQVSTSGLYTLNGLIPAQSNSLQNHYALGINAYARYAISGANHLLVGYWHDYWHLDAINNLTPIDQNGNSPSRFAEDALIDTAGDVVAGLNYRMHSNIDAVSIGDEQKMFDDRLTLDVGVKYFHKSLSGINLAPGPQTTFSGSYTRWSPRGTIAFDVDQHSQIYANIIASQRPPVPIQIYPNTYSTSTGKIAQFGQPNTGPETSLGEEIGYRFHGGLFNVDVAAFNKIVRNRQISGSAFLNGAGVSTVIIVGTQRTRGATVEIGLRPIYGFSPYANAQYLDARTESNYFTGLDYLPTKGLVAPAAPKWTTTAGLNYQHGPLFANVLFRYTGPQFSTLINDQKAPAYHTFDLGIGYSLPKFFGQKAAIKFNVVNAEDKPYLGAIATVQPNAVATKGINGTTVAAAQPLYTLSSPRAFLVTISSQF